MNDDDIVRLALCRSLVRDGSAADIRRNAAVSLADVASAVGVAAATVWRWENGQRVPRRAEALRYLATLERLAAVDHDAAA